MDSYPNQMRLTIILKSELSEVQARHLSGRLAAPEHQHDNGPAQVWHIYQAGLYAFIHKVSMLPIAIAEASGCPSVSPGWWIDSTFRRQGYGNELVDLLAEYLKAQGVTSVRPILIDPYQNVYDEQSAKLAKRFRTHFGHE